MEPLIIYDYDPRNLPQEAQAAIGLSVACAAQTEHCVEMAIGGCLGLDAVQTGAVLRICQCRYAFMSSRPLPKFALMI